MFGPFKSRKADVIEHWIAFADGFTFSSLEFYSAVEKELKARNVPGLEITHVEFAEGGLLSDKRIYLRMLRERLVFDVCAAPFGTRYFFSCRMAEIPVVIHLWQLLVVFIGLWIGFWILLAVFWQVFGFIAGSIFLFVSFIASIYVLRNAVAMGFTNLDTMLIRSPVVGPIYERWFRKETYYRIDTRLMYLDTVSNVVKRLAVEVTSAKGLRLVRQYQNAPVLGGEYKVLPQEPAAPPLPPVQA